MCKRKKHVNRLMNIEEWFHHTENIGQARLNNFLMTGTILLVTAVVALDFEFSTMVSIVISFVGILLSIAWLILGCRQSKFHRYLESLADSTIKELKEMDPQHIYADIRKIQRGKECKLYGSDNKIQLNWFELKFSSRGLLTLVPMVFLIAYFLVLLIAFDFYCSNNHCA